MFTIKLPTTIAALCGRILALAAIGAAGLALFGASAASAQPAQGTNTPKGCPVEDEHGNVTYVSEGTRIGLFVCGSDGEWHFGWLVNARQAPQQPVGPPGTVSSAGKVSVYMLYEPSGSQSPVLAVSQAKASSGRALCRRGSTGLDRQGRMYECKSGTWVLLWLGKPVHKPWAGNRVATAGGTGVRHANAIVNHPGGTTVHPISGTTNQALEGHTTGDDGSASEEECQQRGEHLDGLATDIRNEEAVGGYDTTNQVDQFKSELNQALERGCFIMD